MCVCVRACGRACVLVMCVNDPKVVSLLDDETAELMRCSLFEPTMRFTLNISLDVPSSACHVIHMLMTLLNIHELPHKEFQSSGDH